MRTDVKHQLPALLKLGERLAVYRRQKPSGGKLEQTWKNIHNKIGISLQTQKLRLTITRNKTLA